jgi:septal ring factor EnvC (AmiA/AmiB activator)
MGTDGNGDNVMASEMTFATALNEAKQVIIQQSNRIKTDLDKIKSQQQTIVDQCATITEQERKLNEQAASLQAKGEECSSLESQLKSETEARSQAEGVVDRQGERITTLQASVADLERQISERDTLQAQIPSKEDEEALQAMLSLLTKKVGSGKNNMRIGGDQAEAA